MSTRNGPSARAHALTLDKDHAPRPATPSSAGARPQRYSRADYAKVLALQEEVARADGDYQRLRNAYMDIAQKEPENDLALAMIGFDMDRAHSRLQALIGLPRLPFTHESSAVMRREARHLSGEQH